MDVKIQKALILLIGCTVIISACQKMLPAAPAEDQLLDGPIEGLTTEEHLQFIAGDIAFNDDIFTAENGLGPYFVASSCGSCHAGDGKGHPSTTLTRFGQYDGSGNQYMSLGGPQLQNKALPGYNPESLPAGATFSKFTPPANTGLGFLEALTDAQILANEDPFDIDGDGISGVANYISPPDYFIPRAHHQPTNGKYIGRFGKKSAAIDLLHQTVNAYNQDMGVTSIYASEEPGINGIIGPYADPVNDPEVPSNVVLNVVFYLRTLKAPIQRNQDDPDVLAGEYLFYETKCTSCHTPSWTTGVTEIDALSNKTFSPYTDLLLHDMGVNLDDGYTEGSALNAEWRTPPLWGLGLSKDSQGGNVFLLHDGRAKSIEEAILLHGGEALESRNLFEALNAEEKQKLFAFLESL